MHFAIVDQRDFAGCSVHDRFVVISHDGDGATSARFWNTEAKFERYLQAERFIADRQLVEDNKRLFRSAVSALKSNQGHNDEIDLLKSSLLRAMDLLSITPPDNGYFDDIDPFYDPRVEG